VTTFRIELRPAAVTALRKLDPAVRFRMQGAIALLADDPRPPASRPLRGRPGYRVRVGDYRIIYTVADDVLLIVVVTLGHRREVYGRSAPTDDLSVDRWRSLSSDAKVSAGR